jgi:hypothetical protein
MTGVLVPGKVYPYGNVSDFIPDDMTAAQEAQDESYENTKTEGDLPLLAPTSATGKTLQVLQYYNGELQGQQVMLYLSDPDMESVWTQ